MLKHLRELVEQRASFAFESTLSARSYAPWIRRLRKPGYAFHLLYLWLDNADLAVQRVSERVRAGGDHLPEPTIRRRYQRGIRNVFDLYQALADSWAVYDNSSGAHPELIGRGGGRLAPTVYRPDLWFEPMPGSHVFRGGDLGVSASCVSRHEGPRVDSNSGH